MLCVRVAKNLVSLYFSLWSISTQVGTASSPKIYENCILWCLKRNSLSKSELKIYSVASLVENLAFNQIPRKSKWWLSITLKFHLIMKIFRFKLLRPFKKFIQLFLIQSEFFIAKVNVLDFDFNLEKNFSIRWNLIKFYSVFHALSPIGNKLREKKKLCRRFLHAI